MAGEGVFPKADGDKLYHTDLNTIRSFLGEIRMFALSMSGAGTKAQLQTAGWAICDGTTATAQGIASADITSVTPDFQSKFSRGSDDESSGTTGGAVSHNHGSEDGSGWDNNGGGATMSQASNLPPYYEIVFFMKVKLNIG